MIAEIPPDGDTNTYHYTNTGDSDVSPDGATSQFLLFRGLEATVTAQLLAKGAAKLYKSRAGSPPAPAATVPKKPAAKVSSTTAEANLGAREGSIRRVLLVKDRRTDESWRYGFVEFATVEVRLGFQCGDVRRPWLTSLPGLPSGAGQVQLARKVYDILQAGSAQLRSHGRLCSRL